jgi:glycerol-3-phosphate acyltransferase PlsY
VIAWAQRYSSLASLTGAATAPIFAYVVTGDLKYAAAAGLLSVILLLRHWTNIRRLWAGTEPKIGSEKPTAQ